MAIFTITSFSTFAGLLLAARKLGLDPDPVNRVKALADLASNGKVLAAVLRDSNLTPLAAEMTRQAEEHARHFTHPGPARDDALALFWQVAPEAFADPAVFAAAGLDPARTTEAMVAAVKASPQGRDFTAAPLPEAFFRAITRQTLGVMLAEADYLATITPELWRETLRRHGIAIELLQAVREDTTEILALVRELHAIKRTTVPEDTLIAMARKISPRIADRAEALLALDAAADRAAQAQARGQGGSNADAFVDATLRRLAALTAEGELDRAATEADAAVDRAETGMRQLLKAAVTQHLLAFDAEGAARQIARGLTLETPDPAVLFALLQREREVWYERGRDKGARLDLDVAIELARISHARAVDTNQRGMAWNDLGLALATLGERESGVERLEASVGAFRAALEDLTRERVPLGWATVQMNLGNALLTLGERESGTARLEEAVEAYRAALELQTRERVPLDWAKTQMNLGNALLRLGERERGTMRLEAAVAAYSAALGVRTREHLPLDWAMTLLNFGNALTTLGARERGTARLEEAVTAYLAVLDEFTRKRVPLGWATTQMSLGNVLLMLGARESGTARLKQAVAAYRSALLEQTRERMPLDWAATQMNLGTALWTLGQRESGTERLKEAVVAFRAALEERTRERMPLDWASATGNQALAMLALAERTSDLGMARAALDQLSDAKAVLRAGGHTPAADSFGRRIPAAEALVARLSGSPDKG
ncbi:MAG TPA: tetratricopeptide repeat protein [Amaricoccus sp.]|uniref:hypothetical protein n=1 Tax=Amaricoccus sp. TaxID=1872485 RepID=UPI002C5C5EE9|nr:hypothetical protein [Amaricoccus sp.]HMQ94320.1 tetratricopeptide repeat protein [Amaricoccus sp.]HMR51587.1 tetratricopeptide repeat protein [Amaricoccus sp.]HMR60683.1 tetratricopeptide repeat protein [Amaricoccus sp.]HMT98563.1 tetratricopeptide repeat protein [Amaricoccus sp.]